MSKEIIDAFLADPHNAKLRAQWEAQFPDPRDSVIIRHLAFKAATGFDDLVAILERELEITRKVMARSPKLLKSGKPTKVDVVDTNAFPSHEGETTAEWNARLDAEAARLGVDWIEIVVDSTEKDAKYWELQGITWLVYAEEHGICLFLYPDKSKIAAVAPVGMSIDELENIIQGLRLLRAPFNGAVVP